VESGNRTIPHAAFRIPRLQRLVNLQYNRNDITFERRQFRVGGDNGKNIFRFPVSRNTQLAVQE